MITEEKKVRHEYNLPVILLKFSVVLCVFYLFSVWTFQSDIKPAGKSSDHPRTDLFFLHKPNESTHDEQRIARHFAIDTLPGLMRMGLIKKYERHESGSLLLVAGKVWKNRSKFFKECFMREMIIYNHVNGYAGGIRVLDSSTHQLYAHVLSENQKEFYD